MSLIDDLRRADVNNLGSSPFAVQAVFAGLLFAVICGLGWYMYFKPQHEEFDSLVAKEATMREEFEQKQERAANLQAYREQLQQIELVLQQMLRRFRQDGDA